MGLLMFAFCMGKGNMEFFSTNGSIIIKNSCSFYICFQDKYHFIIKSRVFSEKRRKKK